MKIILLTIITLSISLSSVFAQHDIKINLTGILFRDLGIGYEFVINEKLSAGIFVNSVFGTPFINYQNVDLNDDYTAFKISPEVRYYINTDFGADGRYFSAYARYSNEKFSDIIYQNWVNNEYVDIPYDFTNTSFIVGIGTGKKWIFESGLYVETLYGAGMKFNNSNTFSNAYVEDIIRDSNNDLENYKYYSKWDFRLQISLGYRFSSY